VPCDGRKITSDTQAAGRTVRASEDDPQYLVKSEKSGGEAVHKPLGCIYATKAHREIVLHSCPPDRQLHEHRGALDPAARQLPERTDLAAVRVRQTVDGPSGRASRSGHGGSA
jgi:hypothetical protein